MPRVLLLFLLCGFAPLFAQPAPVGANLVQSIRSAGLDLTQCFRVRDLTLAKEDLKLYLTDGVLIFSKPVNGERISAAFSADVEGGDGEVLLLPPYAGERQSLAKFTHSPNLDQHFRAALLLATDGSLQDLFDRLSRGEEEARRIPEIAPLMADQWSAALSNVTAGFELRLVQDLLTPPANRRGLRFAAIGGTKIGNFDVFFDASAREQITIGQLSSRQGGVPYDIWTSFPARSSRSGGASGAATSPLALQRFRIDAALDANLHLNATVRVSAKMGADPVRAMPFEISRAIHVTAAHVDGVTAELVSRPSERGSAVRYGDNDQFLVIAPSDLAPSTVHEIEFEEDGAVILPAGNDVYFVGARASWYPRSGVEFALYDLTFRYPKRLTLVTAGDVTEDRVEGDSRITRRVTPTPIRVAGFNLGDYEKIAGGLPGFRVEVYGNRRLENALQPKLPLAVEATDPPPISAGRGPGGRGGRGAPPPTPTLVQSMPSPPDPLARLRTVAADISSAVQFYSGLFGPPASPSLTVSPIPGTFGQGFPGLVYLSTLAYLNPNERPSGTRGPREQVFFSDLMQAHEVAHQWWGNLVVPAGYQDEWLSEALSSYSALLYLEKKKGAKAMEDVLEDYRDTLVKKNDDGVTAESAGPITLGFRLEAGSEEAFRDITYYKGAWVFHMLRRRIGDDRFLKMLAELRHRYDSAPVSTAQFRALVKQFLPPGVTPAMIDSFFDTWVYSTGIPSLKLNYTSKGVAPAIRLSGTVEQSGVSDDFSIEAPVEVQFAKGSQIVWVETTNAGAIFSAILKQPPVKVSIPIGTGVLAAKK